MKIPPGFKCHWTCALNHWAEDHEILTTILGALLVFGMVRAVIWVILSVMEMF